MKFAVRVWLTMLVVLIAGGCDSVPTEGALSDTQSAVNEAGAQLAVAAFDPQAAFDSRCAHCHDGSIPKAPHQIKFQLMGRNAIAAAMTDGLMQVHAKGLSSAEIGALADHLGGAVAATVPVERCTTDQLPATKPALAGWSLNERGNRFIPGDVADLSAQEVSTLAVKWVFAYPGATRARAQPVPFGDAILIGSQSGAVYALDLETGCAHWSYQADVEVRSAIAVNDTGDRAFFGDLAGQVYAIDPRDGSELWRTQAHEHPDVTITGSPRWYEGTLYVPLSSSEWGSAADPGYACCTFRGGVVAIDASSGEKRWVSYSIPEEPALTGKKNEMGVALYHPAGAPIWNNPTIDVARNQLLVGTGEAYTSPASGSSDSVIAFDLTTGARNWKYQSIAGDAWNMACFIGGGANCPEEDGPDLDIGAPPMVVRVGDQDLIIAGQKSGDVFALNPESGALVWRTKVGRGGFAGGVHWGMASAGPTLFVPNADTIFTGRFTGPRKPGLFALDAQDGSILWHTPAPDVCAEADKPACDPGLSAAVTAIPDVVFAGAFDGHLRAYDATSGKVLWDFDTNRSFESVSGEIAHGGSIEADGPVVYNGHVLVNSGYLFGDRMAGNALVVFAPAP
ncbi:MAG: PQQ-binding-like beta-propeller repeat protein [Pseudomonadales bacterium]